MLISPRKIYTRTRHDRLNHHWQVAARTGCNIETIRYYEKEGLLPKPTRSSGGHRLYSLAQVERLTFIRRARELGFSMFEIKQLHSIVDGELVSCEGVKKIADDHLEEIDSKIADLVKMQAILTNLSRQCSGQADIAFLRFGTLIQNLKSPVVADSSNLISPDLCALLGSNVP